MADQHPDTTKTGTKKPDDQQRTDAAKGKKSTALTKADKSGKMVVNAKTLADTPTLMTNFLSTKKLLEQVGLASSGLVDGRRMVRLMVTAANKNPDIFQCTLFSLAGVLIEASTLGVEIDDFRGHAYIVVFKNSKKKGVKEAQLMIGYKGLVKFAWQSDKIKDIKDIVVYENDQFDWTLGLKPNIVHVPLKGTIEQRGQPAYFYALVTLTNGGVLWAPPISVEEVHGHAIRFSKRFKKGVPDDELIWYGKKTALRQTLKLAPMGDKGSRAVVLDEMAGDGVSQDMASIHKDKMANIADHLEKKVVEERKHNAEFEQESKTQDASFEDLPADDGSGAPAKEPDPEPAAAENKPASKPGSGSTQHQQGLKPVEKGPQGRPTKQKLVFRAMNILSELKSEKRISDDSYQDYFDRIDNASENHRELTDLVKELEVRLQPNNSA